MQDGKLYHGGQSCNLPVSPASALVKHVFPFDPWTAVRACIFFLHTGTPHKSHSRPGCTSPTCCAWCAVLTRRMRRDLELVPAHWYDGSRDAASEFAPMCLECCRLTAKTNRFRGLRFFWGAAVSLRKTLSTTHPYLPSKGTPNLVCHHSPYCSDC